MLPKLAAAENFIIDHQTNAHKNAHKDLPSIGVSLHRWGEMTQNLKFDYLYKSHCKSYELL
jgi:hypothetical protein